ncbi:MAG: DEAD/DEAH box helicase [Caldithrix sp.]|nr:DEAD/DEAH box helicase [Caldithrix sp.]
MAIKVENNTIYLGVKDLIVSRKHSKTLSSFPLPQRGMLGQKAQINLQRHKKRHYGLFHSEYHVKQEYNYQNYTFVVQGRIDGVYQLKERVEIEEIKSVILEKKEFRNLQILGYPEFSDQVLFYAYLLQDALGGLEVGAFLILINLIDDARQTFKIPYNRLKVENSLFNRFSLILSTVKRQEEEQSRRQNAIRRINFELPENRPQQKALMQTVHDALSEKQHLMVSAPTGIGKTAAALYPAIRYAYLHNKKIFFLTSKTTQQNIVRQSIHPLIEQNLDLHTLFIRASKKMCANDVFFCHETYCAFAKDFHDRLLNSNTLQNILEQNLLTPEFIFDQAIQHTLCPFETSMEAAQYADILVGDYNYVFDPAVSLRQLFQKKDNSDWILIIDEAHNLYDRGVEYLSPQLKADTLKNLADFTARKKTKVYQRLAEALQNILQFFKDLDIEGESHHSGQQYFQTHLDIARWEDALALYEAAFIKYLIEKIKKKWLIVDDPLESFFFALRRFVQVARNQSDAFTIYYNADSGGILHIQCCDPSEYLGRIIDRFHAVIAMSATLDPMHFYQSVLGFPEYRTQKTQMSSPFPADHRRIIIAPHISTRYKDRNTTYPKIAEIITQTIRQKTGNYLVFFPSFEFLQNVNLFLGRSPYTTILQRPGMTEQIRDEVLNELRIHSEPKLLLAVMGGIFSEGIDYAGDMAIGVIIISPALPKISYDRELLRNYYDNKLNMGMEYAYIFPGMNKVIQSVGRLIRSATDRGIVLLIGERFASEEFNHLLPSYWFEKEGDVVITSDVKKAVQTFWKATRK